MSTRVAAAILCGALALAPSVARPAEDVSLEQLAIEMATTPAQHAAVAKYYRGKAEEARSEAAEHEAMARGYGGGKLRQKMMMQEHCKKLSEDFSAMAKEYDQLADLHAAEAK